MRCIRCNRPLQGDQIMIGKHAIGRICARIMGIVPMHQKRGKGAKLAVLRRSRAIVCDGQVGLFACEKEEEVIHGTSE
jgi:hypothetical protein